MKGIIYIAINTINQKVYVGQTTQSLKKRKNEHKRHSKNININTHFYNAIRKYGFNSFTWEIIAETDDQTMLNELEIFFIELYNSKNRKKGYNIKEGGLNGKHSKESIQKMSEIKKGKVLSKETKKKMSKVKLGDKNSSYRHDIKDEEIVKLYKEGMSSYKIAEKYDCSYMLILSRLKKNGKKIRNKRERLKRKGLFGFTGTSFIKDRNPEKKCWESRIFYNKKLKFLGLFEDPLSAEIVYIFAKEEIEKLDKMERI